MIYRFLISFCGLYLIFLLPPLSLQGQYDFRDPEFRFEEFTLPNGELGNHVQSVVQDEKGMMWFGSQFGLHRWDGYQFTTFLHDPLDPATISSSYIEYLLVGSDGGLWIGTWGGGLNYFDPETETFTSYLNRPKELNSLSSNFISCIAEDFEGNIWVATQDGLNRFDPDVQTFQRFRHDPADAQSLSYDKVRVVYVDAQGTLWAGAGWSWEESKRGGLNKFHPEEENFTHYFHQPGDASSLLSNKIIEIYEDSKYNFWIGTQGDGLHLMDRASGTFERKEVVPDNLNPLNLHVFDSNKELHTRFVFEDESENLWVGSWAGGLSFFEAETGYETHFRAGRMPGSIPDEYLWGMFQSRDGTLWCWTAATGAKVFKITKEKQLFNYIPFYLETNVLSFHFSDTTLWVGTDNSGLHKIYMEENRVEAYRDDFDHPEPSFPMQSEDDRYQIEEEKTLENIDNIEEDAQGNLWLGKRWNSKGSNLLRYDQDNNKLHVYHYEPEKSYSLSDGDVMDMIIDDSDNLWVMTSDGVLNKYLPEKDGFRKVSLPFDSDAVVDGRIYSRMTLGKGSDIWITGTRNTDIDNEVFLYQFIPEKREFIAHHLNFDKDAASEKDVVCGLEFDEDGYLWLLTRFSLYQISPNFEESKLFVPINFGTKIFHSMAIDHNGMIWLGSDGLIVFNPVTRNSYRYDLNAGIMVQPFFIKASGKSKEGDLVFGGKGGMHAFHPDSLRSHSAESPEVIISSLEILDQTSQGMGNLLLDPDFRKTGVLELDYDQNIFSIRFAGLDFMDPKSNRHEFKLLGYDENWRPAGLEPLATYIKVPPGEYEFQVRAANSSGQWSAIKQLTILISPPWYNTWAAYGIYFLLSLALIYLIYRFQLTKDLANAETVRLKEFDRVKTQLYTNITHEFRTPLTVILGMARQISGNPEEHLDKGLNMIVRNGDHLLSLVNQMLDLSKLESGNLKLEKEQGDVMHYLQYLLENFQSLADQKDVQIHFLPEMDALVMDHDPKKFQQIISNLMSNAIKFSPNSGHIYVTAAEELLDEKRHLVLKVRDSGEGISEEHLPHIFDRFFQADNSDTRETGGSGIGLAMTRELVKLMKGRISVKSKRGKGSEFKILLPIIVNTNTPKASFEVPDDHNGQLSRTAEGSALTAAKQHPIASELAAKILIIEDNPDVVQYLSSCLADQYHISIGTNGVEGIEIAREIIPDLVISDVMMPYKDGFEVCETLKSEEMTSHIPVILLTAKANVDSRLEGLESGADAYLPKPFHKEELLIRIRKLLELRQTLQHYYRSAAGISSSDEALPADPQLPEKEDQFVQKIRHLVEVHLDDYEFTVERLCREAGMSNSQLHRKLTALTGLSATHFIRFIRLGHAKELLKDEDMSITAVAFDSGFNDPSYFGRVFKKEFGLTPKEWQERSAHQP